MVEVWELSALELIESYRERRFSPVAVLESILQRLDTVDQRINAFREIDRDTALAAARASAERWKRADPIGLLDGVPVSVKDLIPTRGMATLQGSRTVDPAQAWDFDAPAVASLRKHGAIIFGKTTTSEFGNKIVTESPLCGITRNPWAPHLSSGGSSGGAAAAVAAGLGPLAVATDGGGSIRIPSNWCGVFGFKPSYKRIPAPLGTFNWLGVTGAISRTVADAALMMNVMTSSGQEADWQALPFDGADYLAESGGAVAGIRMAFTPTLGLATPSPEIEQCARTAAATFGDLGARVEEVSIPALEGYVDTRLHSVQWAVSLAALIRGIPEEKRSLVDPDVLELARMGEHITTRTYYEALNARERLAAGMHRFFADWDVLVSPTFHVGPPPVPGLPEGLREAPRFTSWVNQTMQPAASIPCRIGEDGLPIGIQVVSRRYADALVIRVCRAFEKARGPFPMPPLGLPAGASL